MILGQLIPLAIVAIVIFALRTRGKRGSLLTTGQQTRYFFHYATLLTAALVTASGLSGVVGGLLDRSALVAADASQTALNLAMVIIGAPVTAVMATITKRRLTRDRRELDSFGWSLFITVASVAPVVVAMFGAYQTLLFLFQVEPYDGYALGQAAVWSLAWYVVMRVDRSGTSAHVGGRWIPLRCVVLALIGLVVGAVAVGQLVSSMTEHILDQFGAELLVSATQHTQRAGALLIVGGLVWFGYWIRGINRSPDSDAWRFVVIIFGVGGGLVTAIVSSATLLYQVAVWFIGTPTSTLAREHFAASPDALGAGTAGLLAWWYHRSILASRRGKEGGVASTHTTDRQSPGLRTEMDRIYEYVMSAGGLLTGATGLVLVLAGLLDGISGGGVLRGDTATNSLLLALILLFIGGPVWFVYWNTIHRHNRESGEQERTSLARRIYLVVLLGVGGLVALGAAISFVYILLRDIIEGRLAAVTVRDVRFPLSLLLVALAVAWQHLAPYRELHGAPAALQQRRVIVAGPPNADIEAFLQTLSNVETEWVQTVDGTWPPSGTEIVERLRQQLAAGSGDVMIIVTSSGVHVSAR